MNVLLIYHGCINILGGAQRVVLNVASYYKDNKIFLLNNCKKIYMYRVDKNFILISLPFYSIGELTFLPTFKTLKIIVKLIKSSDVIHLFYSETPFQLIVAFIARLLNKIVISSHLAFIFYIFHHKKIFRIISLIIILFKILISYLSNIIHTPLFSEVSIIKKLPFLRAKIVYIPHGISLNRLPDSVHFGRRKFIGKLKLMYLGRFTTDKGAFVLLDAAYLLKEMNVPFELVLVGPRNSILQTILQYVKKYPYKYLKIKDSVKIIGDVDENMKYALIMKSHYGIIPSLSDAVEAFSIALSEFNALGRYVVASRIGALKYRLSRSKAGILVTPRNPVALAKAIKALWEEAKKNGYIKIASRLPDTITFVEERERWNELISYIRKNINDYGEKNAK